MPHSRSLQPPPAAPQHEVHHKEVLGLCCALSTRRSGLTDPSGDIQSTPAPSRQHHCLWGSSWGRSQRMKGLTKGGWREGRHHAGHPPSPGDVAEQGKAGMTQHSCHALSPGSCPAWDRGSPMSPGRQGCGVGASTPHQLPTAAKPRSTPLAPHRVPDGPREQPGVMHAHPLLRQHPGPARAAHIRSPSTHSTGGGDAPTCSCTALPGERQLDVEEVAPLGHAGRGRDETRQNPA